MPKYNAIHIIHILHRVHIILITVRHNDATFALQDSLFAMRLLSLDEVRTQRGKVYSALVLQRVALISVREKVEND